MYVLTFAGSGGSGVIAIVDAFDYPTAENALNVFSTQFRIPCRGCYSVVYASGNKPRANCGWAQEAALDIEWARAMAPSVKIVLVEAASNSFADLFKPWMWPQSCRVSAEVSMSWGGSEFSTEASNDTLHFSAPGVVYFASSGDTGGVTIYPGVSPNVVSAGGPRSIATGMVTSLGRPAGAAGADAQANLSHALATKMVSASWRPSAAFQTSPSTQIRNPASPFYDSTSCQGFCAWMVFGGTSVSSPSLAGIVNLAGGSTATHADSGFYCCRRRVPSVPPFQS